eukprot:TRINITY_DN2618_c0_g1_i3.p1 TRINITY_DN2618_c0_g1~~TRINITY_DN2618_c0_g1_i3.p1  ORF type:complete len:518 (+),score=84.50 TRINITY_DN2618_c0_g1_i3:28-1581(+)
MDITQFLSGGIFLFFLTPIVSSVVQIFQFVASLALRKLMVEIELREEKDPYRWVAGYISIHPEIVIYSQRRSVELEHDLKTDSWWGMNNQSKSDYDALLALGEARLKYLPGEGLHILWYKKSLILVWKFYVSDTNLNTNSTTMKGAFTLMSLNKSILDEFLKECMENSLSKDKDKTAVFFWDGLTQCWVRSLAKPKREIDSVILDDNVAFSIIEDAKLFLLSRSWYRKMGVPYRRSYLFHGKPGCGKTSFITAMAGALNLNVCVLTLTKTMSDLTLSSAMRTAPPNSLLLLEDLDVAFPSRNQDEEDNKSFNVYGAGVTFSGLLNSIDGIAAQEGRIIMMTTNHMERLDPALIRPGRVDRIAYFPLASKRQAKKLYQRFFPEEKSLAEDLERSIPENSLSMAQLQGLFLKYRDEPLKALNGLQEVMDDAKKIEEMRRIHEENKKEMQISKISKTQEQLVSALLNITSNSSNSNRSSVTNSDTTDNLKCDTLTNEESSPPTSPSKLYTLPSLPTSPES